MELLTDKDLKRQVQEAGQILEILTYKVILPYTWKTVAPFDPNLILWTKHPSCKMWAGHVEWLKFYFMCALGEYCSRGFENNIYALEYDIKEKPRPYWLGLEEVHQSHRSYLVRSNPEHYSKIWPNEKETLLFWPE
jgi:hypothetical protein